MPAHNAVVGAAVAGAIGVVAYNKYQQAQIEHEERVATEERQKRMRDAKEQREREEEKEGWDEPEVEGSRPVAAHSVA